MYIRICTLILIERCVFCSLITCCGTFIYRDVVILYNCTVCRSIVRINVDIHHYYDLTLAVVVDSISVRSLKLETHTNSLQYLVMETNTKAFQ